MKPYRTIPIKECGEPLIPIPKELFSFFDPPPYMALGAPYEGATPWMLRKGILAALKRVQENLTSLRPGWKIMFFDAYRPNQVQAFMVDREFGIQAELAGLHPKKLTDADQEFLEKKVYRLFAMPSEDPNTPPPHSTGAAFDCTLSNEHGIEIDMGSPVDENSDRSYPNYFATSHSPIEKTAHANRIFLNELLSAEGFIRHHAEWWHFSQGDQYWAWTERQNASDIQTIAKYGRANLL